MRGGIAERGGVRVGHRIIEINGQSVVAMAHEKIVQTLSVSVGEVRRHHHRHATDYRTTQITVPYRPFKVSGTDFWLTASLHSCMDLISK